MDTKPFFHEISDEEFQKLVTDEATVEFILENYEQPTWCDYPEALSMIMGCWSLCDKDLRKVISEKYCASCECYNKKN